MKAYWGSGGIESRILDLSTRWIWVVSFTIRPLYPQGKSSWCPLDKRLGGPQNRRGRGGEEKNSQPPPGLKPPIIQRFITELSRLLQFKNERSYTSTPNTSSWHGAELNTGWSLPFLPCYGGLGVLKLAYKHPWAGQNLNPQSRPFLGLKPRGPWNLLRRIS